MGASSGMGLATAEALVSRGVRVGLGARHTEIFHKLKERYPDLVEYARIDITHPGAVKGLEELIDKLGGMDLYFHVAGIGYENLTLDPVMETSIINTNATGFARMIDTAYRYFRKNGNRGHIAAITSVAGTKGIGRLSAYSATKAFDQAYLVALAQLATIENMDLRITDIRPGWVDTPLLEQDVRYPMEMTTNYAVSKILKAIARNCRAGRGRSVAVIDWRWNIVVGLWRLLPNCLWTRMPLRVSLPDAPLPKPEKG